MEYSRRRLVPPARCLSGHIAAIRRRAGPGAFGGSNGGVPAKRSDSRVGDAPGRHPHPGVHIPIAAAPATNIDSLLSRSEEHTSELQSLMRISSAVFCLKKK